MHVNTHKTREFQLHFRVDLPVPHLPPSLSFKEQTQVANILMKDEPNNLAVPSLFHFSNILNTTSNPNGILGGFVLMARQKFADPPRGEVTFKSVKVLGLQ